MFLCMQHNLMFLPLHCHEVVIQANLWYLPGDYIPCISGKGSLPHLNHSIPTTTLDATHYCAWKWYSVATYIHVHVLARPHSWHLLSTCFAFFCWQWVGLPGRLLSLHDDTISKGKLYPDHISCVESIYQFLNGVYLLSLCEYAPTFNAAMLHGMNTAPVPSISLRTCTFKSCTHLSYLNSFICIKHCFWEATY